MKRLTVHGLLWVADAFSLLGRFVFRQAMWPHEGYTFLALKSCELDWRWGCKVWDEWRDVAVDS